MRLQLNFFSTMNKNEVELQKVFLSFLATYLSLCVQKTPLFGDFLNALKRNQFKQLIEICSSLNQEVLMRFFAFVVILMERDLEASGDFN